MEALWKNRKKVWETRDLIYELPKHILDVRLVS